MAASVAAQTDDSEAARSGRVHDGVFVDRRPAPKSAHLRLHQFTLCAMTGAARDDVSSAAPGLTTTGFCRATVMAASNLYQRNGTWYVRVQIDGRDYRRSLMTRSKAEAEKRSGTAIERATRSWARLLQPQWSRRNHPAGDAHPQIPKLLFEAGTEPGTVATVQQAPYGN